MAKTTKGAAYVGDGHAWIPGVPMRDVTVEEWAALSDEQRQTCLATGLYVVDAPIKAEARASVAPLTKDEP